MFVVAATLAASAAVAQGRQVQFTAFDPVLVSLSQGTTSVGESLTLSFQTTVVIQEFVTTRLAKTSNGGCLLDIYHNESLAVSWRPSDEAVAPLAFGYASGTKALIPDGVTVEEVSGDIHTRHFPAAVTGGHFEMVWTSPMRVVESMPNSDNTCIVIQRT